jgi:hypothetical protein
MECTQDVLISATKLVTDIHNVPSEKFNEQFIYLLRKRYAVVLNYFLNSFFIVVVDFFGYVCSSILFKSYYFFKTQKRKDCEHFFKNNIMYACVPTICREAKEF